jgi:hypothetical protein
MNLNGEQRPCIILYKISLQKEYETCHCAMFPGGTDSGIHLRWLVF